MLYGQSPRLICKESYGGFTGMRSSAPLDPAPCPPSIPRRLAASPKHRYHPGDFGGAGNQIPRLAGKSSHVLIKNDISLGISSKYMEDFLAGLRFDFYLGRGPLFDSRPHLHRHRFGSGYRIFTGVK